RKVDRMARTLPRTAALQMPMRTGNASATAASTMPQNAISQAARIKARRREGASSIRLQECAAQGRQVGIVRDIAREQITDQLGIRQLQKLDEGLAFFTGGCRVTLTQVSQQQEVQLLHAPAAMPLDTAELSAGGQASSS